jgi:hypothetical protein
MRSGGLRGGKAALVWATSLAVGALSTGPASPVAALAGHPMHPHRAPDGTPLRTARDQLVSSNWSGYAVAHYQTGKTYTAASAIWTVPAVTPPPGFAAGYSSSWVGIGGFCLNSTCSKVDKTLIQLGTEQDASSGGTRYFAWYELLPHAPVAVSLTVRPGDTISASLALQTSRQGQVWQLVMTNLSTGQRWSTTVPYNSSLASAEWIEEAPWSGRVLPLADFGTVTFDPGTVDGGQNPGLTAANGIVLLDPDGQASNISGPDADTDGFRACWASGNSLASCAVPSS